MTSLVGCTSGKVKVKVPEEFTEDFNYFTRDTLDKYTDKVDGEKDGIVFIMTEEKHEELVKYFKEETDKYFKAMEEDQEDLFYIEKIENTEDYSEIKVYVDKKEYHPEEDFSSLVIGMTGSLNRIYMGENPNFKLEYIDSETGKVISSETFPGN